MLWLLLGAVLVVGGLWARDHRSARHAPARVALPPDPFVDRRSMVRYHAALRPKHR